MSCRLAKESLGQNWRMALCVVWVLCGINGSDASECIKKEPIAPIFQPGLVFYNFRVLPGTLKAQDLTAARAEVQNPPNLLRITDLNLAERAQNPKPFKLHANTAVYDLESGVIQASDGFLANRGALSFEGRELWKETQNLIFDAIGHFEIQLAKSTPLAAPPNRTRSSNLSPFHFEPLTPFGAKLPHPMAPLELVQNFAQDLSSFAKCWRWTGAWGLSMCENSKNAIALISKDGGHVNLHRNQIQLAGPAAIIHRQLILISTGGVQISQEGLADENFMKLSSQGEIQAWMHAPGSDELWIRSNQFDCVSDPQIIQFMGGPIMVGSRGVLMSATEDWQYARVFPGGRIVLSPGNWNTTGSLIQRSQ
jgi:hypothetical protein